MRSSSYAIDAADRICYADDRWDRFALDNDSPHLVARRVLGTLLWDHISGPILRQLTRGMVGRVRRDGVVLRLPFRCDSPGIVRAMRLNLSPASDGRVEFLVDQVEERRREPIALLDVGAARGPGRVTVCSWCKRTEVDGAWLPLEEAVEPLALFETELVPQILHGLCPECEHRLGRRG